MTRKYKGIFVLPLLALALSSKVALSDSSESRVGSFGTLSSASAPQYWVTDSAIFAMNALNIAKGLEKESSLSGPDSKVIGNQAQLLVSAIDRATSDLQGLLSNANAPNSQAVQPIRQAQSEFGTARTHANELVMAANQESLGSQFGQTVKKALDHLTNAQQAIANIAQAYGVDASLGQPSGEGGNTAGNPSSGARNPSGNTGAPVPGGGGANPSAPNPSGPEAGNSGGSQP